MKEIEVEVLVSFENTKEEIEEILSKFKYIKTKYIKDIYFIDPLRKNLKSEEDLRMNEIFRIRRSNNKCMLTYKKTTL